MCAIDDWFDVTENYWSLLYFLTIQSIFFNKINHIQPNSINAFFISKIQKKEKNTRCTIKIKLLNETRQTVWYVNWFCDKTFANNISFVYHNDVGRLLSNWWNTTSLLTFDYSTLSFKTDQLTDSVKCIQLDLFCLYLLHVHEQNLKKLSS